MAKITKGDTAARVLRDDDVEGATLLLDESASEGRSLRASGLLSCRSAAMARVLLEHGADIEAPSGLGRPLQLHAANGSLEIVETLLAAGADVDAGNLVANPLVAALQRGHLRLASLLLAHGARADAAASRGASLLGLAAIDGDGSLVDALVRNGAHVDEHCSLVSFKVPGRRPRVLRFAPLEGASVSVASGTPLHVAAWCGHAAVVRPLVAAGVRLEARDSLGQTALAVAVANGHDEVADALRTEGAVLPPPHDADQRLLESVAHADSDALAAALRDGASPNVSAVNPQGGTPALCLAAAGGHLHIVSTLLDAGARIDPSGWSGTAGQPLEVAMFFALNVSRLIDATAKGKAGSSLVWRSTSPLDEALRHGHMTVARLLMARGARSDKALVAAALSDRREVVLHALEALPDLEKTAPVALLVAAAAHCSQAAIALVERGIPHELADIDRLTALGCAVRHGDIPLARALLARGTSTSVLRNARRAARGPVAREMRDLLDGTSNAEPELAPSAPELAPSARPGPPTKVRLEAYAPEMVKKRLETSTRWNDARETAIWLAGRTRGRGQESTLLLGSWVVSVASGRPVPWGELDARADRLGCMALAIGRDAGRIHVVPTSDPLDAIGILSPHGPNADVRPGQVLRFAAKTHAELGIRIRQIDRDYLELLLLRPPSDPMGFLRRVNRLRPDSHNDEDGVVRLRRVVLWWD